MRRIAAPPWVAPDHTGSSMSPTGRHDAHVHVFDTSNPIAERRTRQVMWLTLVMMVVEIARARCSVRWRCWPMAGA